MPTHRQQHRRVDLPPLLLLLLLGATLLPCATPFSNVTLQSHDGSLEVVVYLPHALKPLEPTYYMGSRFDHGSMIGSIKRRSTKSQRVHTLFDGSNWRQPHNAQWPESGIGLAAEFGVGDDGPLCQYRCGWEGVNDISNGVLGYEDAKNGEAFLKIGVGALIKGSCPQCDSTDNYRFNSPYEFAELPHWTVLQADKKVVSMEHEAYIRHYGYRLHKDIVLDGNVLAVTSVLTNLGSEPFSTAWYSHNFFTCDGEKVRQGYGLDLDIRGQRGKLYDEPGVIGSWAQPLRTFANVREFPDHVTVDVARPLEDNTRIKAEFVKDSQSHGSFTLHGCGTMISSELPDLYSHSQPMYAYNLYLEAGTFSPEPQILLNLDAGETISWTQRLVFEDDVEADDSSSSSSSSSLHRFYDLKSVSFDNIASENVWKLVAAAFILVGAVFSMHLSKRLSTRSIIRAHYNTVPDVA